MIEVRSAAKFVDEFRSAALDFAPEADGIKALTKMLAKHALSDEHASVVVASWISHWPKWPRPSDLKNMCETTADPRMAEATKTRKACERCDGVGWIVVLGPFGTSAAYPCSHQPETEADRRKGVPMSPAVAAHYRQLEIEAQERRSLWVGSNGHVEKDEIKRVNLKQHRNPAVWISKR